MSLPPDGGFSVSLAFNQSLDLRPQRLQVLLWTGGNTKAVRARLSTVHPELMDEEDSLLSHAVIFHHNFASTDARLD